MKIDVHITRVETGETRVYHDDFEWTGYSPEQFPWMDDHSPDVGAKFQWAEGNYSCDCNRVLFFERVINPQYDTAEDDPNDVPCGEGLFRVKIVEHGTDRIIYEEVHDEGI